MFSSVKCKRCDGKLKDDFSFCPFCGLDLRNPEADMREFGMLGKNDSVLGAPLLGGGAMGLPGDFNAIFAQVMKMMEHQFRHMGAENVDFGDAKPEITRLPNGIQIKLGPRMIGKPQQKQEQQPRVITDEQKERMKSLPRGEARINVRRFSDKVVYELNAPGVENINDIFVSKLESGYEVKAVGKKKVYVNSLQIALPMKKYFVKDDKLTIEFGLE
ncbi:MAG: hypothetical protein AABY16_04265 [Nanoarchaeota archaeon]